MLIPQIDSAVARQLIDKIYEKRKAAALELEKKVAYKADLELIADMLFYCPGKSENVICKENRNVSARSSIS